MSAATISSRFEPGTLVTVKGNGDVAFQVSAESNAAQLLVVRVDGRGRPRRVAAGDLEAFPVSELRLVTVATRHRSEACADAPTSTRTQLALFEPHD